MTEIMESHALKEPGFDVSEPGVARIVMGLYSRAETIWPRCVCVDHGSGSDTHIGFEHCGERLCLLGAGYGVNFGTIPEKAANPNSIGFAANICVN